MLGKVQSGKTSHMLGMVSDAATKGFALASIFTGVNIALNSQLVQRIQDDLSDSCVAVYGVPTRADNSTYRGLLETLKGMIAERMKSERLPGVDYPMPVLVTLKNPARVKTLARLVDDLKLEFGDQFSYLMIDDEADQASQNGAANRASMTATYKLIGELRQKSIKHAMLAYTATPQAVLLSEREGLLRPDRCVTVPPKLGYFGLEEFLAPSFANNLIVVDDVASRASLLPAPPESLREAVLEFIFTAVVRHEAPDVFYQDSLQMPGERGGMRSVQMMIHESSAVKDHRAIYELVKTVKTDLLVGLRAHVSGTTFQVAKTVWGALILRIGGAEGGIPLDLNTELAAKAINLLNSAKMLVVNADTNSPNFDEEYPSKDEEWEAHKAWILIGGDILGRGLTIPQLTTSYFLRASKRPNFDTVSQQMRFCGYRKPYQKLTSIRATQQTIDLFRYMEKIEAVVWRYAEKWDRNRTSLTGKIPPIMYAAPMSANLEPTRKNVRDPNLRDIKKYLSSELLYSARGIFNPSHVYQNIQSVRGWFDDFKAGSSVELVDEWTLITGFPEKALRSLIPVFITSDQDKQELRALGDLFDDAMGELGLGERPSAVYISTSLLRDDFCLRSPAEYWQDQSIFRAMATSPQQPNMETWIKSFGPGGNRSTWGSLRSPHVGGSQRNLVRRLPFDGTVLVIEPITGTEGTRSTTPFALGLGITIFKPSDFEVRMIGHA